jgi:uncharacterized protein (TIGR03437 family)
MRRILLIAICAILADLAPLLGQGITLTGTGYGDPSVIRVAPGQIATLFVTGLKTVLPSQRVNATIVPLPATLAGISVTLNQTGSQPAPVPMLSVQQVSVCSNSGATPPASGFSGDCLVTAITVQIPFELAAPPGGPVTPPELVVSENGSASKAFRVLPVSDNLHVINNCDLILSPSAASAGSCGPLVTHGNGTAVSAVNPARPGEEIVIWAFGLGATAPTPRTGQASPTPAATLSSLPYLQFDFRINAAPSPPYINPMLAIPTLAPNFAGLTPGQVGLYQINVTIPSSIPAVGSCGVPSTKGAVSPYNIVQSNLTIDIGANASFDGAAICVQPQ